MSRGELIRSSLEKAFQPVQLKILDESAHHAGHAGASPEGETHFRVEITSTAFAGQSRVTRHRMVYKALEGNFDEGLHALTIVTHAPNDSEQ